MFVLSLSLALILFLVVVAQPEEWPSRIVSFLREHHIHHG